MRVDLGTDTHRNENAQLNKGRNRKNAPQPPEKKFNLQCSVTQTVILPPRTEVSAPTVVLTVVLAGLLAAVSVSELIIITSLFS